MTENGDIVALSTHSRKDLIMYFYIFIHKNVHRNVLAFISISFTEYVDFNSKFITSFVTVS